LTLLTFGCPTYNQELDFKRSEGNFKFLICKENRTYGQERMTRNNI